MGFTGKMGDLFANTRFAWSKYIRAHTVSWILVVKQNRSQTNKGQIVSFYYAVIKIEQQGLQWPLTCSGCGTLNLTVPPAFAVVPDVTHAVQRSSERPCVHGDPGHASPFSCRKAKRRIGCCGSWCVPVRVGLLHGPQKQTSPATGLESQIAHLLYSFPYFPSRVFLFK